MRVLIIGGGGREHALAWKAAQSECVEQIFVAPGNAGTAEEAKCCNVDIAATDITALLEFAQAKAIDLTIVGPEAPLAAGIVDCFSQKGLACFGPCQAAAQLEASKAFAKEFMLANAIPTAEHATFSVLTEAVAYLAEQTFPIVIKADGLAAGKGVIIADDYDAAVSTVTDMLAGDAFGEAGAVCVIEEFVEGEELSFMAMVDGVNIIPLASSQDHKRLLNDDAGPNTGGMGAYSPAPLCTAELAQKIMSSVMQPVVRAMQQAGTPYLGFLYAGLMVMPDGSFKVLEFNCRLGDPETQALLMRLQGDLIELISMAIEGRLDEACYSWDHRAAMTVVMVAGGYPKQYQQGDAIAGLDQVDDTAVVFHAGTAQRGPVIVTNGGRVLSVTALGETLVEAGEIVYANIDKIHWQDCFFRHDIGYRALQSKIN